MLSYSIFCWIVFPFIIIIAAFVETVINRIKNPNSPNSFEEIFKEEIGAVIIAIIAIIILLAIKWSRNKITNKVVEFVERNK